jgi:hypothetical protein
MPKLTGKRIAGYLWAGPGQFDWREKEKHHKLEDHRMVSAFLGSPSGGFLVRCKGATCEIEIRDRDNKILATAALRLPHGRK